MDQRRTLPTVSGKENIKGRGLLWKAVFTGVIFTFLCLYALTKISSSTYKNDVTYAVVMDVAKFSKEHDQRLPYSWHEFVDWEQQWGNTHQGIESLKLRYELAWGLKAADFSQHEVIFTVLDSEIKNSEGGLNELLKKEIRGNAL